MHFRNTPHREPCCRKTRFRADHRPHSNANVHATTHIESTNTSNWTQRTELKVFPPKTYNRLSSKLFTMHTPPCNTQAKGRHFIFASSAGSGSERASLNESFVTATRKTFRFVDTHKTKLALPASKCRNTSCRVVQFEFAANSKSRLVAIVANFKVEQAVAVLNSDDESMLTC